MDAALLALVLARPHAHSGEAFSKSNTRLRRAAARGREAVTDAIGEAVASVTSADASPVVPACRVSLPCLSAL